MTRWHRKTLVKRGLAYQINDGFHFTRPTEVKSEVLLSFELNPRYQNLFKADNPPKTSFAITDSLEVLAWNPTTKKLIPELCVEASTLPLGVLKCFRGIHFTNLHYASWATQKSLLLIMHNEANGPKPPKLALCTGRDRSFKLVSWDKPTPKTSWCASAEALANFITHGILSLTDDFAVLHLSEDQPNEDFYRVQLDSSIREVFQLWDTYLQVPNNDGPAYIGRYYINRLTAAKIPTRQDLEWEAIYATEDSDKFTTLNLLPTLVSMAVASQIVKTLAIAEDGLADWFTLSIEELKHHHENIDYFSTQWKF